jgi:predicted amidophosphoribosyltransferase
MFVQKQCLWPVAAAVAGQGGAVSEGFHKRYGRVHRHKFQSALDILYPPLFVGCGALVESDHGLCGLCWRKSHFITGSGCWTVGQPLIGNIDAADEVFCDSGLIQPPPWRRGGAVLSYLETGRALVLALKHGDCHDIVRPAAKWMVQASGCLVQANMLVVPVPLHWTRLVRRRYNQAALLSAALARRLNLPYCTDVLVR